MTSVADRFKLIETNVLNSTFCSVERQAGQIIAAGNYGSFNDWNELIFGAVNVGTVLRFAKRIENYLYIDVVINGAVSGMTVYAPNAVVGVSSGVLGVVANEYTARIPYCGPIDSILFQLDSYIVKSITVVSVNQYTMETTDFAQFTLLSTVGWTLAADGETYSKIFADGAGESIYVTNELNEGNYGRLAIATEAASGLPLLYPGYTVFDGLNSFSNFTFSPLNWFFETVNGLTVVQFTNSTGTSVILNLKPKVVSIVGLSTTYGASLG